MRIDKNNTYLFLKGNKNDLIQHQPDDLFGKDFTVLATISPDFDIIKEEIKKVPFHTMGVISKNGKHMGLFFTSGLNEQGLWFFKISFEWWETTENPDEDKVNSVDIYTEADIMEAPISIAVWKKDDQISIKCRNTIETKEIKNLIDYSFSYTWIGAANRLYEDFNHIFSGDISFLHVQEGILPLEQIELGFNDYTKFLEQSNKSNPEKVIYTGDFSQSTLYKVKDDSNNYNHLIKFSKEWLN